MATQVGGIKLVDTVTTPALEAAVQKTAPALKPSTTTSRDGNFGVVIVNR